MTSLYSLLRGRPPFDQRAALRLLAAEGIGVLHIEFSGGNDEGAVDGYTAKAPDGSDLPFKFERVWPDEFVPGEGYRERKLTDEERRINTLLDTLEQPIDDRYGSFAGDFHVNGQLTYDVAKGTVSFAGNEETPHSEPIHLDL